MAKVLITDSILSDLASVIRSKNGSTATYTPSEMVSAISAMQIDDGLAKSMIARAAINDDPFTYSDSTLSQIGSYAFYGMQIRYPSFPYVQTIRSNAFGQATVNRVYFPECITIQSTAFYSCHYLDGISFPKVNTIQTGAFSMTQTWGSLSYISLPVCNSIGNSAFYNLIHVESVQMPSLASAGNYAFYRLGVSVSIPLSLSFSMLSTIGAGCFASANISYINLGSVGIIQSSAFNNCQSLTTIYASNVGNVGSSAFYHCYVLSDITFSSVISQIGSDAFLGCSGISGGTSFLSGIKMVGYEGFGFCNGLISISMPNLEIIYSRGFTNCGELKTAIFTSLSALSGSSCFISCYNLLSIYLLSNSLVTLGSRDAFTSTPISTYTTSTGGVQGSIYVPSSLYNSQKTATNWTYYSARFASLTDAQISTILNS